MSQLEGQQPPGWYYAHGDPPATQRYWDGTTWVGAPQPVPGSELADVQIKTALPMPRVGARIIDWLIWLVIMVVVSVGFGGFAAAGAAAGMPIRAVTVAVVLLYETITALQAGATLGKMTVGLKLADTAGGTPAPVSVLKRSAFLLVVGLAWIAGAHAWWAEALVWPLILVVALAGFVMLFTSRNRQTPWDRVSGTIVVPR